MIPVYLLKSWDNRHADDEGGRKVHAHQISPGPPSLIVMTPLYAHPIQPCGNDKIDGLDLLKKCESALFQRLQECRQAIQQEEEIRNPAPIAPPEPTVAEQLAEQEHKPVMAAENGVKKGEKAKV